MERDKVVLEQDVSSTQQEGPSKKEGKGEEGPRESQREQAEESAPHKRSFKALRPPSCCSESPKEIQSTGAVSSEDPA